jgi:hypothetical protein
MTNGQHLIGSQAGTICVLKAPLLKEGEDKYVNKPGSQTGHNSRCGAARGRFTYHRITRLEQITFGQAGHKKKSRGSRQ